MRIFKILVAASFFIFLFLPLSQCSRVAMEPIEEGSQKQIGTTKSELEFLIPIIKIKEDLSSAILILLTFSIPLATSILSPKRKILSIINNVVQLISASWLGFVVYAWVYGFYSPLFAGHMLFALVLLFFLISFLTLIREIRTKYNNYDNEDSSKNKTVY